MSGKRPSDTRLREKMNEVAMALLDAHYGQLIVAPKGTSPASLPEDEASDTTTGVASLPKADIFNAVVNWLRTDSGMEPISKDKSGISVLKDQRDASRR